ncbi:MAG: hypothetical protein ACU84H_09455 [Gammaproteobacteria bacterium]
MNALERGLQAPSITLGSVLEPLGHGLLLHGVHPRQAADAGLVEHDRSGGCGLNCVQSFGESPLEQHSEMNKFVFA